MPGIRAELVFESASSCPVAQASECVDGPLTDVSWTAGGKDGVAEQFEASGETEFDAPDGTEFEEVFDYGQRAIYEFERSPERACVCEVIEAAVGPVTETYAEDGELHVTLHAGDMTGLREHIRELKSDFGDVRIEYLVRGRADDEGESDIVPVDVRRLTDRQREVVATAYEMGYFEYPRESNASEVAAALDIEPSTFTEHLNAAQSKILDELQFAPS